MFMQRVAKCTQIAITIFLKHLAVVPHTLWGNFEILRSHVDIFAKKRAQVRFAHNNNNYKKIWNFSPIFGQILTSSKDSLTSATIVANMALASSWDLSQSKDETPGSKTQSSLSNPH
jgi:hypothetical protein